MTGWDHLSLQSAVSVAGAVYNFLQVGEETANHVVQYNCKGASIIRNVTQQISQAICMNSLPAALSSSLVELHTIPAKL